MKYLNNLKLTPVAVLGLSILLASGCGGGGSSDADEGRSDTTITSRGIITGFGSVYVNGTRFRTEGTHFSIDDNKGDQSDLRVGMIVTVKGSSKSDSEGSADSITYDNELKGPVSAITPDVIDPTRKTLTILGQAVLVTTDTTIDDDGGLRFDNIALNDVLEVSGYITDSGFTATHIELQDNDLEIEIKGRIEKTGFTILDFAISYDSTTRLDDIAALADGLYVEVEGQLDGAGTTLIAREIEGEDEGLDGDMDEAEIKGVISEYNVVNNTFMVQGQKVDASGAELEPASLQLADGLIVEVEGYVSNGVLIADEIEQKGQKIKIKSVLSAVDTVARTVSFNFNATTITVRVNSGTEIEDGDSGNNLLLGELSVDDFVEMEGFAEDLGVINAVEIERTIPDEIRIVAPLQDFNKGARTVVMLGVDFDLLSASFEDDNDNSLSADAFFDRLTIGEFIKIKDSDSNAVFDKAELED